MWYGATGAFAFLPSRLPGRFPGQFPAQLISEVIGSGLDDGFSNVNFPRFTVSARVADVDQAVENTREGVHCARDIGLSEVSPEIPS
ncbi:MAG: hypothetical protein LBR80_01245 [Deltaproteobacteria bacterium]|jgi:hypothetical protein|nr:hypothetical protein [Deltaproteobacteria bacterium]